MKNAHYCMKNESHVFKGENSDGIRCPYCDGLVNVKPVSNEKYNKLPNYHEVKKYRHKAECLRCGRKETISHTKDDYQEVRVCPECDGALVDVWKKQKYIKVESSKRSIAVEVDADVSTLSLKLRAIAKHTQALADELESIDARKCSKCGSSDIDSQDFISDSRPYYSNVKCASCGHEESESFG